MLVIAASTAAPATAETPATAATGGVHGYLALPESVRLPLNGADGAWVPAAGFVAFVVKHGRVVAVEVGAPAEGKDFQEVGAALAQEVADRMP